MSRKIVFIIGIILILLMQIASAKESKFTEEYNKKIISEYIEDNPIDSWNIFVFEKKFGSKAAISYLAGIVLMALIIKRWMK